MEVGGITAWQAGGFAVKRGAQKWDLERQVRLAAGIGAGLTFAAVTDTCATGMLLARLPSNCGAKCDAQTVVSQLVSAR